MKKNLMIVPALVLAFAFTVSAAFAGSNDMRRDKHRSYDKPETSIRIESKNQSTVTNNVKTSSNTGKNYTGENKILNSSRHNSFSSRGWGSTGGDIDTGRAEADGLVDNMVGFNATEVDEYEDGKLDIRSWNNSGVYNTVTTRANTGKNAARGGSINTGAASAFSTVLNVVGSNVVDIED